jgi:hypothetical protein
MVDIVIPDVRNHLNITDGKYDDELANFLNAAVAAISQVVGPLEPTTVTRSVPGGWRLILPDAPVVSVTSVTPVGTGLTALDLADLDFNLGAGLVDYGSGSAFPYSRYTVVYVAGRTTLPADLRLAVLELVRHYWVTQRGATSMPGSPVGDSYGNTVPGAAYAMPFRVSELLAPHRIVRIA